MSKSSRQTTDALAILDHTVGSDAEVRQMIAEETVNAEVAQVVLDARTRAGLTQRELAQLVGTTQSVIARLEDADYRGHSLTMLQRIAEALGKRVDVKFVTPRRSRGAAALAG